MTPLLATAYPKDHLRLWTVDEFQRMTDMGVIAPEERLELIEGELVKKMTQNGPHATAIQKLVQQLTLAFGSAYHARAQFPLDLGPLNRPEPDVAIVVGTFRRLRIRPPHHSCLGRRGFRFYFATGSGD